MTDPTPAVPDTVPESVTLDALYREVRELRESHDKIIELVSGFVEQVAPMLDKLQSHPMVRMFGGK